MGTRFKQGFTIIETMLVLAVTGVLIATLLVGLTSSINVQRYKDSVGSFKDLLQGEYSSVDNVTNDHPAQEAESCGPGAIATPNVGGVDPGQSDCVIMGRYISVVNDTVSQGTILGYQKSTTPTTNDISDITTNYDLGISTDSIETSTLEWGAQIAWPASGVDTAPSTAVPAPPNRAIGILILRSPSSGTTYTFTTNNVTTYTSNNAFDPAALTSAALLSMVTITPTATTPGESQRFICIDPSPGSTGLTVPEKLAVVIDQAAGSANAIELRSDAITASLGGTTKCQ
jgi:prepilin-type N-terminal cleavage/methylation domain-containing protein